MNLNTTLEYAVYLNYEDSKVNDIFNGIKRLYSYGKTYSRMRSCPFSQPSESRALPFLEEKAFRRYGYTQTTLFGKSDEKAAKMRR